MRKIISKKWQLDTAQQRKYQRKVARINKEKRVKFFTQQPAIA